MTLKQLIIAGIVGLGGIGLYLSTLFNILEGMAKTDNIFIMLLIGAMGLAFHKLSVSLLWEVLGLYMEVE